MGREKALIEIDGVAMADRVATALEVAGCDPVVLVGGEPGSLAELGRRVIPDVHPGRRGPVAGIHAAVSGLGADAVVVIACDLPGVTAHDVELLVGAWRTGRPTPDAVVAHTGRREPLCALWDARCLADLDAALGGGRDPSVLSVLEALSTVAEVVVPDGHLHNVNTPSDLRH